MVHQQHAHLAVGVAGWEIAFQGGDLIIEASASERRQAVEPGPGAHRIENGRHLAPADSIGNGGAAVAQDYDEKVQAERERALFQPD